MILEITRQIQIVQDVVNLQKENMNNNCDIDKTICQDEALRILAGHYEVVYNEVQGSGKVNEIWKKILENILDGTDEERVREFMIKNSDFSMLIKQTVEENTTPKE